MTFDSPGHWEPPAFLVTNWRGVVAIALSCAFVWSVVGGDVVTCRGTAAAWHCTRRAEAVLFDVLGLGADSLQGPNKGTRVELVSSSRGGHAAMIRAASKEFRLATQPTRALAEADRTAWLRWAQEPTETLTLTSPAPLRYRVVRAFVSLGLVVTLLATAWAHLRQR